MENKSNSLILSYKGEVEIKINKSIYKKHNNGTPYFFEQICKWLLGYESSKDFNIDYMLLTRFSQAEKKYIPCIYNKLLLYKDLTRDDLGNTRATFSTSIKKLNLNFTENLNDDEDIRLELYDTNKQLLATIRIEASILNQVLTGRQALVEWSLRFSN